MNKLSHRWRRRRREEEEEEETESPHFPLLPQCNEPEWMGRSLRRGGHRTSGAGALSLTAARTGAGRWRGLRRGRRMRRAAAAATMMVMVSVLRTIFRSALRR